MAYSSLQHERINAYRRRRGPDSHSDSGYGGPSLDARHPPPTRAPPEAGPRPPWRSGSEERTPRLSGQPSPHWASHDPAHHHHRTGSPQTSVNTPAGGGGHAPPPPSSSPPGRDMDIRSYIFDIELQNRDLRKQLEAAQAALRAPRQGSTGGASSALLGAGNSDEAKQHFLAKVLGEVESIVEAHRSKSQAEIQRYKAEAEQARHALAELREVIQTEGLDLTMTPALIAFHKRQQQQQARADGKEKADADSLLNASSDPLGIRFPPEFDDLLHGIAGDILAKLQSVQDSSLLDATMRDAVRTGFQSVVLHFTEQVVEVTQRQEETIKSLRIELEEAEKASRTRSLADDQKRVEMATEHALELEAMRDQLRVFTGTVGGGGGVDTSSSGGVTDDRLSAAMHEKAFAEYAQLLVDARRESAALREELEVERNRSAEVCLKLKAALERRRIDYEAEVLRKAEDVVAQRDRLVADLEGRLRQREAEFAVRSQRREAGVQAGEPLVHMPDKGRFVPHIVSGMHRDSRLAAQSNELYEREVWRKTQELLGKYGAGGASSTSVTHSSARH